MVLTEPGAGSDVSAGTTRARHVGGDDYLLEGVKRFITNGDFDHPKNIVHMVLAPTFVPGDRRELGFDGKGNVTLPPGFVKAIEAYYEGGWNNFELPEHKRLNALRLPGDNRALCIDCARKSSAERQTDVLPPP